MKKINLLQVLECIAQSTTPVSIAHLNNQTGIATSSLNRLLTKLIDGNYVHKVRHGEYCVGASLTSLSSTVIEHSVSSLFKPLLTDAANATGLNAELYSLTPNGPIMVTWVSSRSEFKVRMYPGFRLFTIIHPALAFFSIAYPDLDQAWGTSLAQNGKSIEDWRLHVDNVRKHQYAIDWGSTRPELGRIGISLPDAKYCLALSGLISEFTKSPEEYRNLVFELNNTNE